MIVPEYWAEAKERVVIDGSARTYKRFGWSDASENEALENAQERVAEAADQARQGQQVRLIDHKVSYNGAEGLPIREEVVERHGETVISRNSYGALCLNTPNVLFADVDIPEQDNVKFVMALFAVFCLVGYWLHVEMDAWWPLVVAVVAGMFLSSAIAAVVARMLAAGQADPFDVALGRIESFARDNPSWSLRIYRTPNGYRVLVMHKTFDPGQPVVYTFMDRIDGDRLYARMCRNQNCFRARVSPKPWRIGVGRLGPRPGVWPLKAERMPERHLWVQTYNKEAANFASCRFEKTLGNARSSRECEAVRAIHDSMCKVDSDLPIA